MHADVMALFRELADCQPSEREEYYAKHGVPPAVRGEVESLLQYDRPWAGSLTVSVAAFAERALRARDDLAAGSQYGSYRVIRLLGRGGMGAVYEAQQENPHRVVALKVINPELTTRESFKRFEVESHALGRLQHPGIAQIYEAATADVGFGPQPYFVMELVRGKPLLEYASSCGLALRERLDLMARICDAVHHAHQRGVIHRDLKPANIVVDESGQPKVLDFGVARVTDCEAQFSLQTSVGQLLGTLAYMSPEQVSADPMDLDTRSDVYALGVVLYELLAGRLPYDTTGRLQDIGRAIQSQDAVPLGTINRTYRGDVETIVAKALEKDKTRRYGSAAALAGDIRRYLRDEPIVARPPSASYQLRKFAKRHSAFVAGVAAVFVALLMGTIVSTWQAVRARRAEQAAEEQAAKATAINEFLANDLLTQAGTGLQAANTRPDPDLTVRTALDRAATRIGDRFSSQPLVEASLRVTIGNTYRDLGLSAPAEEHLKRAFELRQGTLGAEHAETLTAANELAGVLQDRGKYAEAEPMWVMLLDAYRRTRGDEDPDTLTAMNNLALLYREMRKYALAEPLQTRVLDVRRRTLGEEHARTQVNMVNLGLTYLDLGKFAEAESLMARVVDLRRRLLGEEHPGTLNSARNLAGIYASQGRYDAAERLMNTLLAIQRRVRGPEHPDTLFSLNILARVYDGQSRYADAETAYRTVIDVGRRSLGEEQPDRVHSMFSLANTYRLQRKDAEAEELFLKVLEVRRRVWGATHPETANTLIAMALLKLEQHEYEQVEQLSREAMDIYATTWPDRWRRYQAQSLLGAALGGQNRFEEAEPLLLSASEELVRRQPTIPAYDRSAVREAEERIIWFRQMRDRSHATASAASRR